MGKGEQKNCDRSKRDTLSGEREHRLGETRQRQRGLLGVSEEVKLPSGDGIPLGKIDLSIECVLFLNPFFSKCLVPTVKIAHIFVFRRPLCRCTYPQTPKEKTHRYQNSVRSAG